MRAVPIAILLLAAPATAQPTGRDKASVEAVEGLEAYAVYKMGQYDDARARWEALAAKGNTTAMINLANMLTQGQGFARDPVQARAWTRKAADLGDPRAQYDLGLAHERGDGVPRDLAAAAGWLGRAADQNSVDAQFALGVLLATGQGKGAAAATPDQRAKARLWLTKAAAGGHREAATYLAVVN